MKAHSTARLNSICSKVLVTEVWLSGAGEMLYRVVQYTVFALCFAIPFVASGDNPPPPGSDSVNVCTTGTACNYSVSDYQIQPAPAVFKLQARISQARLPVGNAKFKQVIAHLLDGTGRSLCSQTFNNVVTRDSVLNLQIGENFDKCNLGEAIAKANAVAFKICIESESNCLKPIDLGTVPFAVKSTYAKNSQFAHVANTANETQYAHRAAADRDLFTSKSIGTGFFDFHTPSAEQANKLYSSDLTPGQTFETYRNGGFLQWVQVTPGTPTPASGPATLHICGGTEDAVAPLGELILSSKNTTVRKHDASDGGNLLVEGQFRVVSPSTFDDVVTFKKGIITPDTVDQAAKDVNCSKPGCIQSREIEPSAVDSLTIAEHAVTGDKIAPSAIIGGPDGHIVAAGITGREISLETITTNQIANGTVTGGDGGDIAANTITGDNIADRTLTGGKILQHSITGTEIHPGSISDTEIGGISLSKISVGTGIPLAKMRLQFTCHSYGSIFSFAPPSQFTHVQPVIGNDPITNFSSSSNDVTAYCPTGYQMVYASQYVIAPANGANRIKGYTRNDAGNVAHFLARITTTENVGFQITMLCCQLR